MRLRDIYIVCKAEFDSVRELEPVAQRTAGNVIIGYKVDFIETESHLNLLNSVELLKMDTEKMYEAVPAIQRGKQEVLLSESERNDFENARRSLLNRMKVVVDLYESMFPEISTKKEDEQQGVQIRLPKFSTLDELSEYVKDINHIFKIPTISKIEGAVVKCDTTDIGSFWIILTIAGTVGVAAKVMKAIAELIKSVMEIRNLDLDNKLKVNELEQFGNKDEIEKSIQSLTEILVKKEVHRLLEDAKLSVDDSEDVSTTENCIKKAVELTNKGMMICPLIENTKENLELFPKGDYIHCLIDKDSLKLITDKQISISTDGSKNDNVSETSGD